jgi:hypothetical protein
VPDADVIELGLHKLAPLSETSSRFPTRHVRQKNRPIEDSVEIAAHASPRGMSLGSVFPARLIQEAIGERPALHLAGPGPRQGVHEPDAARHFVRR